MRKGTLTLILILLLFMLNSCDKSSKDKVKASSKHTTEDGTTAASQKANSWLPETDSTYKVIGYKKGLKGFSVEYNKNLYRGGNILSAEGAKILQEKGIKTVVSITPDDNIKTLCNTFGFNNIEMFYDYGKLTDSITASFLNTLDNSDAPFYIHCFSGKQRAGLLCAISRIYTNNWTFEQAEVEYGKLGGKVEEDHQLLVNAFNVIKERKKAAKKS